MKRLEFKRDVEVTPTGNEELEFSICSEVPLQREDERGGLYYEVLPVDACDWSRLKSGAMAFLLDHDQTKQIGVVTEAWVDGEKIRVKVKFSTSDEARQAVKDVVDGVKTNCSIGYGITDYHEEVRDNERYLIADEFLVYEASLVSVPADPAVGYKRMNMKKLKKRDCGAETKPEERDEAVAEAGQEVHEEIEELLAAVEKLDADKAEAVRKALRGEEPEAAEEAAGDEVHEKIEQLLAAVEKLDADKAEAVRRVLEGEEPEAQAEEKPAEEDQIRSLGALVGKKAEAAKFVSEKRSLKEFKNFLRGEEPPATPKKMKKFNLQKALRSFVRAEKNFTETPEYQTIEENKRHYNVEGDVVVTKAQLRGFPDGTEVLNQTTYRPDLYTQKNRPQKTYEKVGLTQVAADGSISFAVCTSGLAAGFVDLNGDIPSATAEWSLKTLAPKKMGAYTQIGYGALLEDRPEIQSLITDDILGALEQAKDAAIINGSGASGEPQGVYGTSGVNEVTIPSGGWNIGVALSFEKPIRDANNFSDNLAWVMNSQLYFDLKATPKSAKEKNEFLIDDEGKMIGYPCYIDNALPTSGIILGDWSDCLVADFDPITIKVVEDAGLSRKQAVEVQAFAACDVLVRRPSSFSREKAE